MKACVLESAAPIEQNPLALKEVPVPEPGADEVLVRVHACGVCRTDLHVVEGELPPRKRPVIPGHQVVGTVERCGAGAGRFPAGARVGVAWLHRTCGVCEYCRTGRENLCGAATVTGYTVDGGYAEYIVAAESFVYPIPAGFSDMAAAPLLCAGIIGFRSLRVSGIQPGGALGLYGFGAAAHVAIQVARHWGVRVYAMTRDERHRELARELGAEWAGAGDDQPPEKLDAAIIFAPAGELVVSALRMLVSFHTTYAASAMFLTGMAANPLIAEFALKIGHVELTWGRWLAGSIVPGLLTLAIVPWLLLRLVRPEIQHTEEARTMARVELARRGPMERAEKWMVGIMLGVMAGWVTAPCHGVPNTFVALSGLCALLLARVIAWEDLLAEGRAWDALIWFAPLVMMSDAMNEIGAIRVLSGGLFAAIHGWPWPLALAALVAAYCYGH